MRLLFISVLVVATIGVMVPSVLAEEVPGWVKNTVGWWADGKIGEEEFLNSIQYLIESRIIVLASDFQSKTNDSKEINVELPGKYDLPAIQQFSGKSSGTLLGQAQIVITAPDQTTEKFYSPIKNGNFGLFYQITSEHQTGTYYIKAYSGEEQIWQSKFSIHEKSSELIPSWIKNNGKWWNEGKILDSAFLDGIKYLIETQVIEIDSKETTQQGSKEKCESRMLPDGTEILSYLWSDGKCYNVPECTSNYPYRHSDGMCYDGPESELFSFDYETTTETVCPSDYPYLWSDGSCWDGPEEYRMECSDDYPYLWSDGKCYNVPECTSNYPYRHSDGMCYDGPEEYRMECPASHPYEYSDGRCGNVPEFCPTGSYRWDDGQCYNVPDCSNTAEYPNNPYLWSDGTCRPNPEHCTGEYPYRWDDGQCYNIPQECRDPYPWRHSDGMCYSHPPRLECPAGYYQEADYDFCCPNNTYAAYERGEPVCICWRDC